jgi:hypothetical protein
VEKDNLNALDATRRSLLVGSGVAITALGSTQAMAAVAANRQPPVAEPVAGPYPVPPVGRTAGPILPSRGSSLARKVAVVTGAARGIGRAIAIEFAANGADVVALDIAGRSARRRMPFLQQKMNSKRPLRRSNTTAGALRR